MDIIIALYSSTGHRHKHGFSLQHRPQTSSQPSVSLQDKDINTYAGCSKTTDPYMALDGIMDPDTTMSSVAVQATHINATPCSHSSMPQTAT
ncbi:hypothetical protein STEG23_015737 [Scotinomys teguina]